MVITALEFEKALNIIVNYRLQLEQHPNTTSRKINIKIDVSNSTFDALRKYYKNQFNIEIEKKHLMAMDVNWLVKINYDRLQGYRGMGKKKILIFKKLMIFHSVFVEQV